MDKCRVVPLIPRVNAAKTEERLPCASALVGDGMMPLPPQRKRAKVFSLSAARAAAEIRAARAFTFTEED